MKRNILICTVVLLSICQSAFADMSTSGQVKRIVPQGNGIVSFQLKNDNCNGQYTYYSFDGSSSAGKLWYALILSAAQTGSTIAVSATGNCDGSTDKTINYLYGDY